MNRTLILIQNELALQARQAIRGARRNPTDPDAQEAAVTLCEVCRKLDIPAELTDPNGKIRYMQDLDIHSGM